VSRVRNEFTKSGDGFKYLVGGFGPDEGFWVAVVVVEVGADGVLQLAGAAMDAAAQLFFGKQRKPPFDQVRPGAAGGSEVQVEARVAQQPALDGWGFVGAVVIENQVQFQLVWHGAVDGFEKAAKLDRAVAAMELADYGAGLGIQGSEQVDGAMTYVIRSAALGLAGAHRQQRLTAVQRLNLGFLVHAQHQRPIRRMEVQTHDVAHLFNEQRILGELEALDPVRLQPKSPPDTADRALTKPTALGHGTRAPVRCISRRALQGKPYHTFNLRVTDLARCPRTWLVQQTVQPPFQETLAPFADGLRRHSEFARYHDVGISCHTLKHDPRPLRQRLRSLGPAYPFLQTLPLFICKD
jgi:hypothetical protein